MMRLRPIDSGSARALDAGGQVLSLHWGNAATVGFLPVSLDDRTLVLRVSSSSVFLLRQRHQGLSKGSGAADSGHP